jgi:hypothetical protein
MTDDTALCGAVIELQYLDRTGVHAYVCCRSADHGATDGDSPIHWAASGGPMWRTHGRGSDAD